MKYFLWSLKNSQSLWALWVISIIEFGGNIQVISVGTIRSYQYRSFVCLEFVCCWSETSVQQGHTRGLYSLDTRFVLGSYEGAVTDHRLYSCITGSCFGICCPWLVHCLEVFPVSVQVCAGDAGCRT